MKLLVLNGPNMNFLGTREPEIYGSKTLKDLEDYIANFDFGFKINFEFFQSNCEGKLIDSLQYASFENFDGVIFNPAAYTHYSYALHDAVKSINVPVIEVHISKLSSRDELWRNQSVILPACKGQVQGLGFDSYIEAVKDLINA